MIANAAGNYIDNAIAAVDAEIVEGSNAALMQIRRELMMMKEQREFLPSYGRFLVDTGLENEPLQQQLLEVLEWRRRALKRYR
jgi:hypothetical protein